MCDTVYRWLANKFPRKLLYFCVIQAWVLAMQKDYCDKGPDEVTWGMVTKFLNP